MTVWQAIRRLFQQPQTRHRKDIDWLDQEEHRQMLEVRERLDRTERHLWEIDRRRDGQRGHPAP